MADKYLTGAEKALLGRLSIFSGGWTLEAAQAVCSASRRQIEALAARGLIERAQSASGGVRFSLAEKVRAQATEWLDASGEREAIAYEHVEYAAWLAEQAEAHLIGAGQERWLARLDDDYDDLLAALDDTLALGRLDLAMRLCRSLVGYWRARGLVAEGHRFLKALVGQADRLPQEWQARAYGYYADFCFLLGDLAEARAACERGLAVSRQIYEPHDLGNLLFRLGDVALAESAFDEARAAFEECADVRRKIGDQLGLAEALGSLKEAESLAGDGT